MLDNYVGYDSGNKYEFVYDFENNKITIYSDIDMKHDGMNFLELIMILTKMNLNNIFEIPGL